MNETAKNKLNRSDETSDNDEKETTMSNIRPLQAVQPASSRLPVKKTFKLLIDGQFVRTESGRFIECLDSGGNMLANVCRASRKDLRNSVVASRKAFPAWRARSAYNRGQILYRCAEMLEERKEQFVSLLHNQVPGERSVAIKEVEDSIDLLIHFAGWADKYQQVFGSVNPVSSSHFNFSLFEPMGIVGIIAPEKPALLPVVATVATTIVGGNTVVVLPSTASPLAALSLAEVFNTSDIPAGVVNILSGLKDELLEHFSSHMDINALIYCEFNPKDLASVKKQAALNVKRVISLSDCPWELESLCDPYMILETEEVKTTWHPVGK